MSTTTLAPNCSTDCDSIAVACAVFGRIEAEVESTPMSAVVGYLRDSDFAVMEMSDGVGYGLLAIHLTERGLRRFAALEMLHERIIETRDIEDLS